MTFAEGLEYSLPGDPYHDYCLWPYEPPAPSENKLRSANLLFHSFELSRLDRRAYGLVEAIRACIGLFHTVWGIKSLGGKLAWELYFYDYRRRARERSVGRVLDAIRPFVRCDLGVNENLEYFMFSLDVDDALLTGARALEELHLYVGNPGSTVSSGISYSVSRRETRLENFYFFFDARKELPEVAKKIATSAYVDSTVLDLNAILWPALRECAVIVVANKQRHDSVYFSRVRVHRLLYFLKALRYPEEHVSFIEENRSRLDHLLYDVGFDYRMEGREVRILKSGYYGIF